MFRVACPLVTLLLLAPACGDDATQAFLEAAGSSGETGPVEDEDEATPTSLLECALEVACEFPFTSPTHDASAGFASLSDNDRCVFTALARGDTALVETVAEFRDAVARLDYVIVGEGVALRQASGESDAGGRWQNGVFACELRESEFFTGCLKSPSAACLDPEQWVVACQPLDNLVCPG